MFRQRDGRLRSFDESYYNILYNDYRRYTFFRDDAEFLVGAFNLFNLNVLVGGCGHGYLVDELRRKGVRCFGAETSEFAHKNKHRALFDVGKIFAGDLSRDATWTSIKSEINSIDFFIAEDMIAEMDDDEISSFLSLCRSHSKKICHIITCAPERPTQNRNTQLNWKSFAEWDHLLKPDALLNRELSDRRFIRYGLS